MWNLYGQSVFWEGGEAVALVQYRDETQGINISKRMTPPKAINNIQQWWNKCRKTIPEIPDTVKLLTQCSTTWITWELQLPNNKRAFVIVDRNQRSL